MNKIKMKLNKAKKPPSTVSSELTNSVGIILHIKSSTVPQELERKQVISSIHRKSYFKKPKSQGKKLPRNMTHSRINTDDLMKASSVSLKRRSSKIHMGLFSTYP